MKYQFDNKRRRLFLYNLSLNSSFEVDNCLIILFLIHFQPLWDLNTPEQQTVISVTEKILFHAVKILYHYKHLVILENFSPHNIKEMCCTRLSLLQMTHFLVANDSRFSSAVVF